MFVCLCGQCLKECLCGQCLENSFSNCSHRQTNRHCLGLAPCAAHALWTSVVCFFYMDRERAASKGGVSTSGGASRGSTGGRGWAGKNRARGGLGGRGGHERGGVTWTRGGGRARVEKD
jgi:hypothetical protein